MQVRLSTTITTVIEINPGNTTDFETARKEIFTKFNAAIAQDEGQDQFLDAFQALQAGAVEYDEVIATEVTHSFEEVK